MTSLAATLRAAAVCAVALASAPGARAQELPPADRIMQRYTRAMGAEAFAGIRSLHSIGEVSIPVAGITGTIEVWQARPNRTMLHASVPGYGDVRAGFTGENGWSLDPSDGPRVLAGPEADQAADDAHFESHLRPPELIDSMRTVERTTLGGYDCHSVRSYWKSGRITTDCFSVESGLLVGSVRTHHSATGPADALILYEEYREFGNIRLPTRITTRVNGVDQVVHLRNVTLNGVSDTAFEPPPAIRTLLGR